MDSIKFAEWLAENHYRLYNVENKIYYWECNNNFKFKTTKQLFKKWQKENNQKA